MGIQKQYGKCYNCKTILTYKTTRDTSDFINECCRIHSLPHVMSDLLVNPPPILPPSDSKTKITIQIPCDE
jgi:hypothetical protein